MRDESRVEAVIALIDEYQRNRQTHRNVPADGMLAKYFRGRRYIGSKDRSTISGLFYFALRHYSALGWWCERVGLDNTARSMTLCAYVFYHNATLATLEHVCNGGKYAPPQLGAKERNAFAQVASAGDWKHTDMPEHVQANVPLWMYQELNAAYPEEINALMTAMMQEAPLDIRVNTLATDRNTCQMSLLAEGIEAEALSLCETALRLSKRTNLFNLDIFKRGWFEVQDVGSQLIAAHVAAKPGQKVIDFCAGAGGKTLAIAAAMQGKGRICAWDTHEIRLTQMRKRLRRADVHNVTCHVITSEQDAFIKRHRASADWTLVDAPCSGSGTWRRNPDIKWRMSREDVERLAALQASILHHAATTVKQGGHLVYATCSLLPRENMDQVHHFLETHEAFRLVDCDPAITGGNPTMQLLPHRHGADGFFTAIFERKN